MDEKSSVLICVGAAVAANCVSCFRHYYGEALRIGLEPSDIEAAVALAAKVKTGANIAVMSVVAEAIRRAGREAEVAGCSPSGTPSCCSGNG